MKIVLKLRTYMILEQLHKSKTYKEVLTKLKANAQCESTERCDKITAKQGKVLTVKMSD